MNVNMEHLEIAQTQYGSLSRAVTALEIMLKSVATSNIGVFSYVTENIGVDVRILTRQEFERGLQFNSHSDQEIYFSIDGDPASQSFSSLRLPTSLADRLYVQGKGMKWTTALPRGTSCLDKLFI